VSRRVPQGLIEAAAWLPAAFVLAFALLRASGIDPGYPIYALLAFTPYAIAIGVLALVWAAVLRRRWAACAALAGTIVLVALVAPRFLPGDGEESSPPADPLRVMSMNLGIGGADAGEVADLALAQSVDVIAFQELTPDAARALGATALEADFPYGVLQPGDAGFGSGLISRTPVTELPRPDVAGEKPIAAGLVETDDAAGGEVEVWSIHPPPPTSDTNVSDLDAYLESIPGPDPAGPPRLLVGDFNSTLDHGNFRGVLERGYRDAADALGEGLAATWPTDSFPPGVAIDHVLGDSRAAFSDYSVHEITGSDHKALVVSTSFPAP
jgi:endonuclease/exonuclease/phosphatase (EEP) superfamily protein YafD